MLIDLVLGMSKFRHDGIVSFGLPHHLFLTLGELLVSYVALGRCENI